jgi:FMN phosphatase YigB (HAD superfamily)
MKPINTLVFDVGNVLLDWNPKELYRKIVGRDDFDSHPINQVIGTPLWEEMDLGRLTMKELGVILAEEYPEEKESITLFFDNVADVLPLKKGGFDSAREYQRRGYRILLLSNFGKDAWQKVVHRFPQFDVFEGGVISWKVGLIKPDPAIYQRLMADWGVIPEETLFIDDMFANVAAAEALGFKGLHLTPEIDLLNSLARKLNI